MPPVDENMRRPIGVTLLVLFFAFGVAMCSLTIFLLVFPGTPLDAAWQMKPEARDEFAAIGAWAILVVVVPGAACALAAIGLARGAEWGRRIAVAVLAVNLLGDTANALIRNDWRALIGLPIGGAIIAYLFSRPVGEWIGSHRLTRGA